MKIIYLTVSTPLGSGEEFLLDEMLEFRDQGVDLIIIPRSPKSAYVTQDRVESLQKLCRYQPIFSISIFFSMVTCFIVSPRKVLISAWRIIRYSRSLSILLKNLAVFPKALWISRIGTIERADHIHAHWASTTSTMAMVAGFISNIPWSFTAHRWDIVEDNMLQAKNIDAKFCRFISESGLKLARTVVGDDLAGHYHVIHMGSRMPDYSGTEARFPDHFTIFSPGHLIRIKGHRILLQAISKLSMEGFLIRGFFAGSGELEDELKKLTIELGLQSTISFLGHLEHSSLLDYYRKRKVSAVVLASLDYGHGYHEGIPVSLIEAMSYGIPVIATSTGGIPELIDDHSGILVSPNDVDAMSKAIRLLIKDPKLCEQFGIEARRRVLLEFNVNKSVQTMVSCFRNY